MEIEPKGVDRCTNSFYRDVEYAKSLVKLIISSNGNSNGSEKATEELKMLYIRYNEYYKGHMSDVFYPCEGAEVIAWEYAEGLAYYLQILGLHCTSDCEKRNEILDQLELLYSLFGYYLVIAQAYAKGLASVLRQKNAEETEIIVNRLKGLHYQFPNSQSIVYDYALGLSHLTQRQFAELNDETYKETYARLEALSLKYDIDKFVKVLCGS